MFAGSLCAEEINQSRLYLRPVPLRIYIMSETLT